jgi:hypothetical protein
LLTFTSSTLTQLKRQSAEWGNPSTGVIHNSMRDAHLVQIHDQVKDFRRTDSVQRASGRLTLLNIGAARK